MKKIFIIIFLVSQFSVAQKTPEVKFMASPTVAGLVQYADTPVGHYTGVPNISIPLYSIESGGYHLPISLSYHASGIKVSQEASWVGLGWSLNAGGVISRQIRGLDDLNTSAGTSGYFSIPEKYGSLQSMEENFLECSVQGGGGGTTPTGIVSCQIKTDGEPDLFYYNFAGYSGKFILQGDVNDFNKGKGVLLDEDNNLKIDFSRGANLNSHLFIITDPKGIKYEFSVNETSEGFSRSPTSSFSSSGISTDSWLLKKITLNNQEEINFIYQTGMPTGSTSPTFKSSTQNIRISSGVTPLPACEPNVLRDIESLSYTFNWYKYVLKEVNWKGGKLDFKISQKIEGGPKLDQIDIYNQFEQAPLKTYKFTYDYFNKETVTSQAKINSRLKLMSVKEYNSINSKHIPPYEFTYFEEKSLPYKDSNYHDHWGYFNLNRTATRIPKMDLSVINPDEFYHFYSKLPRYKYISSNELPDTDFVYDIYDSELPYTQTQLENQSEANLEIMQFIEYLEDRKEGLNLSFGGADRDPSLEYAKTATLKSIKYPTGGITNYEYELNTYLPSKPMFIYDNRYIGVDNFIQYGQPVTGSNPNNVNFEINSSVNLSEIFYDISRETWDKTSLGYASWQLSLNLYKIDQSGGENLITRLSHIDFQAGTVWQENELYKRFSYDLSNLEKGSYRVRWVVPQALLSEPLIDMRGNVYIRENSNRIETSVAAGGLRIKRIISNKNTREFDYNLNNSEYSTGKLMSRPNYFNYFTAELLCTKPPISYDQFKNNTALYSTSYTYLQRKSKSYYSTSGMNGNIVGYSKVIEKVISAQEKNIETEYNFYNKSEIQIGFTVPNVGTFLNGKPKSTKFFLNNKLIEKNSYNYSASYNPDKIIFAVNYAPLLSFSYSSAINRYSINLERVRLENESNIKYYENDSIVSRTDYEYGPISEFSPNYKMYHLPRNSTTTSSHDKILKTAYYYPEDIEQLSGVSNYEKQIAQSLIDNYRIHEPMRTEKYVNNSIVSTVHLSYKNENGLIVPQFFKTSSGNTSLETKVEYLKHDDQGNILEVLNPESNIHTYYIWGYNKNYPVAKIDNFSSEQALNLESYINTIIDRTNNLWTENKENSINDALLDLQTHLPENSFLTGYTYKPLVGISSVINPNGNKVTYHYDKFNRLEFITDQDGHVLSKNEYQYKN
ncbi:hypothetical protein [Flavivirga eckloniae]|uniref:YD repeat-containing protein n=1 Tax=Flavivirga eckloniae TaxID=1803846 RepID=A0A2K9PSR1_9FLAO|nr:hypothetical protein [Flavivirga eckloniae]AUP80096.1 hypothetical protein C1H87_15830 [Flavivirga eckloniae]